MLPKNNGKAIAGNDSPQSITSSPREVIELDHSPNKRQKISKEGAPPPQSPPRNIQQQPVDPYEVYNRSRHNEYLEHAIMFLNKPVVKEPEFPDVPLWNIQPQPVDPYEVYNRSRHNEYLEHAIMFLNKPVVKEPEIPDVPLPPLVYEEPPSTYTGGLEDIVESAKLICRKKD